MAIDLNERTKDDFLVYANSVIKSRAIPSVEDNLKPIHRKILYTLYEEKVTPDKKTKKCATLTGAALKYSPHGDSSVYGAMIRMGQWWKLRYPLIEVQGNCGNILGDSPAAARYTEARLSPIGMLMLDGMDKNCIEMKPNYDGTCEEPVTLPSRFPYILCGNNSGIAVGMGSDMVSHNFTEVAAAIEYYMDHKDDCTIKDLMRFIKGPDFPTGGKIINGNDLLNIYSTGKGSVRVHAHYDVVKSGQKTLLVFHDLPYGAEVDSGVKEPLKKLVIEEGYDNYFENIDFKITNDDERHFDITVTLCKNANVQKCLDVLFQKTKLADTIKINQNLIVNGEPKTLNLKQLIEYWVNYRSSIIKKIAQNDYDKTNHKLTVVIGLQKCLTNIDLLVSLIRNSESRAVAKKAIIEAFELNDEQAEAVLEMKLSRLNRLDMQELNKDEKDLEEKLAQLKETIEDEKVRYNIIRADLKEIKKIVGKDDRLTEICGGINDYDLSENPTAVAAKQEWLIYQDGLGAVMDKKTIEDGLVDAVMAYTVDTIYGYNANGEIAPITNPCSPIIGAFVKDGNNSANKNKLVCVTKNGHIKVSLTTEYKWKKSAEKAIKLKEGDELIFAAVCSDNEHLMLFNGEKVLKLAIKDLPVASKLTVGVKSGFTSITSAGIAASTSDMILSVTKDNKGKLVQVADFSEDSRGNKGQTITENTAYFRIFESGRTCFYAIPKIGKPFAIEINKVSVKGKTAIGANITTRTLTKIV